MKITPEVVRHEFIGTEAKVARSTHPGYIGISGKIVDETRNTFTLMDESKRKIVAKDSTIFHLRFPDGTTVEMIGRLLTGRPEDRVKRSIRRLW
jgi:ribonuclease P protein subunit POP4